MFDIENKPFNVAVFSDVSDSPSEQETVDSNIEVATIAENAQQPLDNSTKQTAHYSPPQNQKTRSLREIYEQTLVSDEHLQYPIFSSQPIIFEEAMKDAEWVHANEEFNENDEVDAIDEKHQDMNGLMHNHGLL